LTVGEVPLGEIVNDIAQGLVYCLNVISGRIEYSKLTVPDCHKNINIVLKYLLSCAYESPGDIPIIVDAFSRFNADSVFRDWFCSASIVQLGESLTVRALAFVRLFPELGNIDLLSRDFFFFFYRNDLYLNLLDLPYENVFCAILETISCYVQFPENEDEFHETFNLIEHEVRQKIETLKDKKESLLFKDFEYQRIVYEQGAEYSERGAALLFEILLTETELRQFIFAGTGIPLCYFVYFIALDEVGHFSPVVRQAAAFALYNARERFMWEKFNAMRGDFFNAHCAAAPIVIDTSVQEFAYSIEKALCLLGYEFEHSAIVEIARDVFDTMRDSRTSLHNFPLKISKTRGDELLTQLWYTVRLRTYWKQDGTGTKRILEIVDYTTPNSRGIPAVLFKDKNLAVPFIQREYLCSRNIVNEAKIRLRCNTPFIPPAFVKRNGNIERAKDLVLTFMDFLEMYAQGDDTFTSDSGGKLNREDIALMLEQHFDLSALTVESLLHAKIMLWYIEPTHSIFKIDDGALARINEYIEGIYGKPLSAEEAVEKVRAVINAENEKIAEMNSGLADEEAWPLLQEGKPQWARLFNILVQHYTRRNTLTLWELRGVLYDMREKPRKPFYYPVANAIGSKVKGTLSRVLREWLYDGIYKSLDNAETKIDVCGGREFGGKCLRLDRQCCSIPSPCAELTGKKCGLRALT
jgi:hypothetical protein